jgi:DNA processing protein
MAPAETAALVALLRRGCQTWPIYAELVEQAGSARSVLGQEFAEHEPRQTNLLPDDPSTDVERAAADVAAWESTGLRLVTVLDPDYPLNLRGVHDRPPLIFVAGVLEPTDKLSLAVVGSRRASPEAIDRAGAIAEHLTATGYAVASGLAAGIDTAAHTAALACHGRTFAVIGTGLHHVYPPENAALQREIATRGAVISQFWPDAPPTKHGFPTRNALMSGLTLGTVIVEASHRSGARAQAGRALRHGRPVFLAESLLSQTWARELAERPGTHVYTAPSQITDVIARIFSDGALVA